MHSGCWHPAGTEQTQHHTYLTTKKTMGQNFSTLTFITTSLKEAQECYGSCKIYADEELGIRSSPCSLGQPYESSGNRLIQ